MTEIPANPPVHDERRVLPSSNRTQDEARSHLFPHFTRASTWYDSEIPIITRGNGAYVFDDHGRRYLDGLSGLFCVNMGHGRRDIAAAVARQMDELSYWTNWSGAHPRSIELATLIASLAPSRLNTVFFVNSGSEAIESAIKFARQYHVARGEPERVKFIAREWAYHGTTMGALALTGIERYQAPFGPLMPGVRHIPTTLNDVGALGSPASSFPSLKALEEILDSEGPETIAAIVLEPVQNSGGAIVPPEGYWQEVRSICDRHGILLIADEVICAFGRLGEWFGSTAVGAVPDLITFAKGVTSGYAPLGGVLIDDRLARELMDSERAGIFSHGSTWGGHPVATAAALANLEAMRDESVLDNVRRMAPRLQTGLDAIAKEHPTVEAWRGTGYLYAVAFCADRDSGSPLSDEQSREIIQSVTPEAMHRAGLLTRADDRGGTMLVLAPPLISDAYVCDRLLDGADAVASAVDRFVKSES